MRNKLLVPAMRPTLFGARALLFYAVCVGAYFAAPYVNLFFLLLAFLTLHWAAAVVWTARSLRGVSATFGAAAPVAAGLPVAVPIDLVVARGRRFDVEVSLELEAETEGFGWRARRRLLADRVIQGQAATATGQQRLHAHHAGLPRGLHRVRRATLASTYPFGLLRRERVVAGPAELVVHPLPSPAAGGARSAEDLVRDLSGDSVHGDGAMQPAGLRDFVDGDALRSVNWRASARRGKFVVQEWDGGGGDGLEVVLDRRCNGPREVELFEEALRDVAAIVQLAREGKDLLCVRSQGLVETFGDGHAPWATALRFLAAADVLPASGPAPPPTSPRVLRLPRREIHD